MYGTLLKASILKWEESQGVLLQGMRDEQSLKQLSPKLVTLSGKVIEVRDVQLKQLPSPKLVTPSGKVIEVRDEQP